MAGDQIHARAILPDLYLGRLFEPLWFGEGVPTDRVDELLEAVRDSRLEGLDPEDYHLAALDSLASRALTAPLARPVEDLAELELLLTDAFLTLGSHVLHGRVDPEALDSDWLADRRDTDLAAVLSDAVDAGEVRGALDWLRPSAAGYGSLVDVLARLRRLEARGGWGVVEAGPTLRTGDRDPRVPAVRRRLDAVGDLEASGPGAGDAELFDDRLDAGVRRFQDRHGLEPDGAVGERTVAAMNVPVEERIRQVLVNLERWRWLPRDLGRVHVRVNVAAYHVDVYEDGSPSMHMRAIVGREYRRTPIFSGRMRYLVLAPYWHVPPTIAAVDKLPLAKADRGYLAAQHMTLFDAVTNDPVDPAAVEWGGLTGAEFNRRFRLRQDPGPWNALGRVKFMFPNRYNVYLHDTPTRELFGRAQRDFSSGCIRLERPLELAEYLLRGDPEWTPERIREVAAGGVERTVALAEPVPVHLLYFTVFLDGDDRIHLRPDVYGRDDRVWQALQTRNDRTPAPRRPEPR